MSDFLVNHHENPVLIIRGAEEGMAQAALTAREMVVTETGVAVETGMEVVDEIKRFPLTPLVRCAIRNF